MPLCGSIAIFSLFLILLHSSIAQNDVHTTAERPLLIGVPTLSFSSRFVQKDQGEIYTGFSIRVFEEVQKLLDHKIHYKFVEFNGTYDDLVACVGNKTLDAAVGDITIVAKRWDIVEFTVPYTEPDLAMVVPVRHAEPWVLLSPSNFDLWLATGAILLCSMFGVWFLEHISNSDSSSSMINYSRLVDGLWSLWIILALIIMQSLTASFSSWITTVKQLNPDVDLLREMDARVGCNPLMKRFVQNELGYKSENIELIRYREDYLDAFKRGTIAAAFLEIPYAKLLVNGHRDEYTITEFSNRFGGLSFAFQKGSPIANEVSQAILKLSENGMLTRLQESWMSECPVDSEEDKDMYSLSYTNNSGLYLLPFTTIGALLFIARMRKNHLLKRRTEINNDGSVWKRIVRSLLHLRNTEIRNQESASSSSRVAPEIQMLQEPDPLPVLTSRRVAPSSREVDPLTGMKTRNVKRIPENIPNE